MNFHSISLVFTLKTIVEGQICAINEVIGYTWAIAQFPKAGNRRLLPIFIFKNSINSFGRSLFFKEYHHAKIEPHTGCTFTKNYQLYEIENYI